MKSNKNLIIVNFFIFFFLNFFSLAILNANDFPNYLVIVLEGKLYLEKFYAYLPGTYIINKFINLIFNNEFTYVALRILSIFFFFLSINLLANKFLKKETKIFFLIISSCLGVKFWSQIGSYSIPFFFFTLSFINFFLAKKKFNYFLGGLFLGLACLSGRPTYIFTVFIFLYLIFFKNKNKKNLNSLVLSFFGGLIALSPLIFFFIDNGLNSFLYWTFEQHQLRTEAWRWRGVGPYGKDLILFLLSPIQLSILPILIIYLFNLKTEGNWKKNIFEISLLVTLFLSSLLHKTISGEYFTPFFIIILLFALKNIKISILNIFTYKIVTLLTFTSFIFSYGLLKKENYYIHENSLMNIYKTRAEIKKIFHEKYVNCDIIIRTRETIYVPFSIKQNYYNMHKDIPSDIVLAPEWIKNDKNYDVKAYNLGKFEKNDFNAILVPLAKKERPWQNELISLAKDRGWDEFNIRNLFILFVEKNNCKLMNKKIFLN
jgi:hypothetical protein